MNWLFYSILGAFLQGLVLFLVKFFSFNTPPLVVLFFQYAGSIFAMIIYLKCKKVSFKIALGELPKLFLSGFLVSTGLSFYYLAIGLMSASVVVPLHNVGITILPALIAFLLLKEKATKKVVLGIFCSIIAILFFTL